MRGLGMQFVMQSHLYCLWRAAHWPACPLSAFLLLCMPSHLRHQEDGCCRSPHTAAWLAMLRNMHASPQLRRESPFLLVQ